MAKTSYKEEVEEKERKNKMVAITGTVIFHVLLIVALIFTVAWEPPNPPIPQYGIEVNFGLDEAGFGEVQSEATANTNESLDPAKPEAAEPEPLEESEPQPTPPISDPITTPENVSEPEPVEEATPEEIIDQPEALADESDESVETTAEEVQETPKPTTEPEPQPEEETPQEESKPAVNNDALLGPKDNTPQDGTADEAEANNNGDQPGKTGDQGDKDGSLNSDALLNSKGKGGSTSALDMPGWSWEKAPSPKDTSSDTGRIVFEIKIDDSGEILSVKTLFRSVSKAVANIYQNSLYDLTFEPTQLAGSPPPITTGKVTFIITAE